jgi:hypothetical protein
MRFFYRVRPIGTRWEVLIGSPDSAFVYDTLEEATQVARGAARLHWETRQEPSGVIVQRADASEHEECRFGQGKPRLK